MTRTDRLAFGAPIGEAAAGAAPGTAEPAATAAPAAPSPLGAAAAVTVLFFLEGRAPRTAAAPGVEVPPDRSVVVTVS